MNWSHFRQVICFTAVAVFLCLFGNQVTAAGNSSENPIDEYHRLEREFREIPDGDTLDQIDVHLQRMQDSARHLLYLEVDNQKFPAESVYFAQQPDGDLCRLVYADDTAHTTEFPLRQPQLPPTCAKGIQVRMIGPSGTSWPVFSVGDPREMHQASYTLNIQRPDQSGRFTPQLRFSDRAQLLFTIVKQEGDAFFRKYVWIIAPWAVPDPSASSRD
jgi:hypothetical protein